MAVLQKIFVCGFTNDLKSLHFLSQHSIKVWDTILNIKKVFILPKLSKQNCWNLAAHVQSLSCIQLFATPWVIACQVPLSKTSSSQEYWSVLPVPSPGDLPNPGVKLASPALQVNSSSLSHQGSPNLAEDMQIIHYSVYFRSKELENYRNKNNSDNPYLFFFSLKGLFYYQLTSALGLSWCLSGKETTCQRRRHRFDPWVGKMPWRRKWQPAPVFLPGKPYGQRSLVG